MLSRVADAAGRDGYRVRNVDEHTGGYSEEERAVVSDEEMKTNAGEEVRISCSALSIGGASENDPSHTDLIFYPFFYRFSPQISRFSGEHAMPRRPLARARYRRGHRIVGSLPAPRDEERTDPGRFRWRRTSGKVSEETEEVSGRMAANNRCTFVRQNAVRASGAPSSRSRVSGGGFAPTRNPIPVIPPRRQPMLEHRLYPMRPMPVILARNPR